MGFRKIFSAVFALVFAGTILLISDWENRQAKKERKDFRETATGLAAEKGRTYRLGVTYFAPDETFDRTMEGVWDGLEKLGFIKDSNLVVISQHANGEITNLVPVHQNMDNQDVDLILVTSTPGIVAAISSVKKHPVVFTMTFTPLEAGAGKSLTDHLPGMTGVGSFPPVEKTIDFIREIIPEAHRIGTLYNASEVNSVKVMATARKYIDLKGMELAESTIVNSSEAYLAAMALCSRHIDALWVTGDNTALQAIDAIIKVCRDQRMPLILNDGAYVSRGALASVGVGWYQTGIFTAPVVARVLNGENPGSIPIVNYAEEEIIVNKEKARELGLNIPGL